MQSKCLIIMPSGELNGYPAGHINRVYDYIVTPACRLAGFWPTRTINSIQDHPLDIVKEIIDSDVIIFDLSSNDKDVLYALSVRYALNLPFILIKDIKSTIGFYLSEPDVLEYDDSLRIDTVQKATEAISKALKSALETKKERHEILTRLNIGWQESVDDATVSDISSSNATGISAEESVAQEDVSETKKTILPIISPLPDYVGEPLTEKEIDRLKPGDILFHLSHGKGTINFVKKDKLASIQFDSGTKFLVLIVSDFLRKVNA